ncbi:glycosyltransferase [Paludibacterium purpuratum]|uniref:Glycosyl transferase family 1 n=1 Tax=Paludibacterium purpuratum TaxID=1144873 RepID=A0A4R7B3T2_9NEIS|nr:glycosyltransferase [Paludibacterium purpuratum]TDR78456.1 glycosyl transferase family 1 [Paludibacterium purpuratum]
MSVNKIALLVNFQHNTYLFNIMRALSQAFLDEGVDTQIVDCGKKPEGIKEQLENLKPDFIFEINRTRWQTQAAIPEDIPHVAWIQDAWREPRGGELPQLHYTDQNFGGSELIYTLVDPEYFGFTHHLEQGVWGRLHTGIDPRIHHAKPEVEAVSNSAAICGYIPMPLHVMNTEFLQNAMAWNNGKKMRVDQMANFMLNKAKVSVCQHSYPQLHQLMVDEINRYLDIQITVEEHIASMDRIPYIQLLDTEMPRINDRLALAGATLEAGLDLEIYGHEFWRYWPKFASYYKTNLRWGSDLAEIYRRTQFNVHNGCFGMHSRVLECMGSGGSIFVCTGRFNDTEYDIRRHFTPGEHYVPFDIETAADTFSQWRGQDKALHDIAMNAAEQTRQHHTWRHRAQEILSDMTAVQHMYQ